jgi:uncharacterized membrane protein YcaP (DUF421 family)
VLWLVGSGAVLLHTVVKSVLLFVTAVVGFRLGERRTLAELAAFDFVAVISVGAIIGRTATAADSALLTGAIALATVLLTHRLITRLRYRPTFARLVDQQLGLLVVDGELRHDELRKTGLTEADVLAVLRQRGVHRLADVRYLVYETKGAFSVVGPEAPADGEPLTTALRTARRRGNTDAHRATSDG